MEEEESRKRKESLEREEDEKEDENELYAEEIELYVVWCSSEEFENITSFSCFCYVTQMTRISLVSPIHTARILLENQHSIVT